MAFEPPENTEGQPRQGRDAPPPAIDRLPEVIESLRTLGLVAGEETPAFVALTGGVSSDILLVQAGARRFCIKRALPKLKVAALWEAPVERNAAEAAWMRTVAQWLPQSVPHLLGEDPARGLFAMQYLPPDEYPVWKGELRDGRVDPEFAAQVGAKLATIHSRSAHRTDLAHAFAHDATFESIRIEPYLRATARRHPDLAARLQELAAVTLANRQALVHGDISPKNILCGPDGPVFLDAECAWYGDPAFDLAFCLNHLLLKGAWKPQWKAGYVTCFHRLAQSYFARVDWEPAPALESRCAALLPGLWLARIDGKSPVEYLLDEPVRDTVRQAARRFLEVPVARLGDLADFWSREYDT
jgi:aminoglycoside phosphotransferase (APT) family kinase protein